MNSDMGPIKYRTPFNYPARLLEGPSDEEYVNLLLAEANSREDFWKINFDWSSNLNDPCTKCSTTIHGNAFFVSFDVVYDPNEKENDLLFENKYYCEMCAEKEPSVKMMKIQFSKYIWGILKEQIVKENLRDYLDNCWKYNPVICVDNCIPQALHDAFVNEMNDLAKNSEQDVEHTLFGKIQHLIDPSMYVYNAIRQKECLLKGTYDAWILKSELCWLPVEVKVDENGNCKFLSNINNLYKEVYPNLYPILEAILSRFIPIFERGISSMRRSKGQRIQVVIQAMDLILEPGQTYEEDFHFLTTLSQKILGTATYYYEDTESIIDNGLAFEALPAFPSKWQTEIPPKVREFLAFVLGTFFEKYNSIQEKLNINLDSTKLSDSVIQAYFKNVDWRSVCYPKHIDFSSYIDFGKMGPMHRTCVVFSERLRSKQIKLHVPSTATSPQKRRILRFYLLDTIFPAPSTLHILPQQEYYMLLCQQNLQKVKVDGKFLPMDIIQEILSYLFTHDLMSVEKALAYRWMFKLQRQRMQGYLCNRSILC